MKIIVGCCSENNRNIWACPYHLRISIKLLFQRRNSKTFTEAGRSSLTLHLPLQERWGKTAAVETPQPFTDQSQQRSESAAAVAAALFFFLLLVLSEQAKFNKKTLFTVKRRETILHFDIYLTLSLNLCCVYNKQKADSYVCPLIKISARIFYFMAFLSRSRLYIVS